MKVYAIINDKERVKFEKKWQIPYGYSNCQLFFDFDEAVDYLFTMPWDEISIDLVVECCESGTREIVYRLEGE